MSRPKFVNPNIVLDKVKEVYDLSTDADLAAFLGSNPSTIATWRKSKSMKLDRIVEFAGDINLNWLIYDDLPKWRDEIKMDGEVVMTMEPEQKYGKKSMVERIKSLDLPANEKLELLEGYIEVLEQQKNEK